MNLLFGFLHRITGIAVGLIELILLARFFLRLFGVTAFNDGVVFIYSVSTQLIQPFEPLFPRSSVQGSYVLEFVTILAMFAYAFGGYVLQQLFLMLRK